MIESEAELLQELTRRRALSPDTAIPIPQIFATIQGTPAQKLAALYALFDRERIVYMDGSVFLSTEF